MSPDTAPTYGARATKRYRRSKAEISDIRVAIYMALHEDHPQTLRGLFYRLVSAGHVDKTEAAYKTLVGRLCVEMRRAGTLPYDWLSDNTRWMRKPASYNSLSQAVRLTAETYRRSLWATADAYVEVWLEKDALAGVLYDVTATWDVPLMVTRGYPSLTFLYSAAEAIAAQGKPTWLYYLGDFDPSGVDISRKIESELRRLAPDAELYFKRLAVNENQIREWQLPTRPTKKTDSRAHAFGAESVEVDAIPARQLRALVEQAIYCHVDDEQLETLKVAEQSEREYLEAMAHRLEARRG
jgi:hypothetical protein